MAEIRGKENINGGYKINICSFPGKTAVTEPPWQGQKVRKA